MDHFTKVCALAGALSWIYFYVVPAVITYVKTVSEIINEAGDTL